MHISGERVLMDSLDRWWHFLIQMSLEYRSLLQSQSVDNDVVARFQDVAISSPGDFHPLVEGIENGPYAGHILGG